MKNLKELVGKRIETLGITNEYVATKLGMSRVGFWQSLEKSSLKPEKLQTLFEILNIEPNYFFGWDFENLTNVINEPEEKYIIKRKIDTKTDTVSEIEYLRLQNNRLLTIIENFSKGIDTKSIN